MIYNTKNKIAKGGVIPNDLEVGEFMFDLVKGAYRESFVSPRTTYSMAKRKAIQRAFKIKATEVILL